MVYSMYKDTFNTLHWTQNNNIIPVSYEQKMVVSRYLLMLQRWGSVRAMSSPVRSPITKRGVCDVWRGVEDVGKELGDDMSWWVVIDSV